MLSDWREDLGDGSVLLLVGLDDTTNGKIKTKPLTSFLWGRGLR